MYFSLLLSHILCRKLCVNLRVKIDFARKHNNQTKERKNAGFEKIKFGCFSLHHNGIIDANKLFPQAFSDFVCDE